MFYKNEVGNFFRKIGNFSRSNNIMKIKNQRILKNGAIAGYVYYSKDKKWKWRIIGRNNKKGGNKYYIKFKTKCSK